MPSFDSDQTLTARSVSDADGHPLTFETNSYYALRRSRRAEAEGWWRVVRGHHGAPWPIVTLASGRERIELSREEVAEALDWAERVRGWPLAGPAPVVPYPRDPRRTTT